MDEERLWDRIREDVQFLSDAHSIDVPEKLIVNTGSYWEREAQKRQALNEFLAKINGAPQFTEQQPLMEIADRMDEFVLVDDEAA
jgi:hypothetical protein